MATSPTAFTVDAILCDSAMTADGKLFIQGGGLNLVNAPDFPAIHARLGIGMILSMPYTQTNQNHEFNLWLEDEDGKPISLAPAAAPEPFRDQLKKVTARFNAGRPPTLQPGDSQPIPFAMNFDQIVFNSPGKYNFVVAVNDDELDRLPFRVMGPFGITINPTNPQS